MHANSFKLLHCPCIFVYIFDFTYTSTFHFTIILDPFYKQEGELRLRDSVGENALPLMEHVRIHMSAGSNKFRAQEEDHF